MNEELEKFHRYLRSYEKMVKKNAGNFVESHLEEDVAQETFLKMYLHLDYLEESKVKSWLLVVSANVAKNYAKKGYFSQEQPMEQELLEGYVQGIYESAEEGFERLEKQKAVLALLRTAGDLLYERNPDWYYVLIDGSMLGMTNDQIGKVLGITSTYVDVIRLRARKFLQKELGKRYQEFF